MNEVPIVVAQAGKLFDLQLSGRRRRDRAAAGTTQAWQQFCGHGLQAEEEDRG